jgi:uncharacterized membrane protein YeaQ/YmgE (transglycosylase-associated protein family)
MHFILWIIISGFAGFIASKLINKSGSGMILDIVLGIIGGFVGGLIVSHIPVLAGLFGTSGIGGLISELIVAVIGAALVIFLYNLIFRRGG